MAAKRQGAVALAVGALITGFVPAASAATLSVDDDRAECPAAQFTSIQAAIDAAAPGDAVAVCPGSYTEGTGGAGTNALTISKSLTLRGAGADVVTVRPSGSQIADAPADLRNGVGDILSVAGAPGAPIEVDVSGLTFDGAGTYVEAGVVFRDAAGSVSRSRVTRIVTSESADAGSTPGGYRYDFPGIGIAFFGPGSLSVDHTRIDSYNQAGVLLDGATSHGELLANQIAGRTQCFNYTEDGDCSAPGALTTGTLFGQDGIRIGAGSAAISDSTISSNLVNGSGAPSPGSPSNNANLSKGSGIRLLDAAASSITRSNIVANAYGVFNALANGTGAGTVALDATNNWWGLSPTSPVNPGPAISPSLNPLSPENPVNGNPDADGSTTVNFRPYRDGNQADPNAGEWPVVDAPIPVDDLPPAVSLAADEDSYEPGSTVTLTADATDDFGVAGVTFYDGAQALGTDATPPYTRTVTVAAGDTACAARGFSAVAEDSTGQTGSGQASAKTGCVSSASGPPEAGAGTGDGSATGELAGSQRPADQQVVARPSVRFSRAPARLRPGGGLVAAAAEAAAGVARVDFFLGSRRVCSLTKAPYDCLIIPTGADVGAQALRVVVTDTNGATGESAAAVVVSRFQPRRLGVRAERVAGQPRKRKLTGRLRLPQRVTAAQGCMSGTVALVVKRRGRRVLDVQVPLTPECTYSKQLRVPRGGKQVATARFTGNKVLTPLSSERRRFR